jgi:coenzyme F420 hydrogenase subunit beta
LALPLSEGYGTVLELWEGHAVDPDIRNQGSSGGALTALGLYCLEAAGMHAVVHIGQDPEHPFRNRTFFSRDRAALVSRTGSRYAPASACDRLREVELASGPVAFIGQPMEVTAVRKAITVRPALGPKIGVTLSFFCAGSPSMLGTIELARKQGIDPASVASIRYRGFGWPGHFRLVRKGETEPAAKQTYAESWAFVQAFRPHAVHLWPDGTGEDADIACGDPWYEAPKDGDVGSSLVVVRTERGREVVRQAVAAGYLKLTRAEPWKLVRSQEGLIRKRGSVWGRLISHQVLGLPAPRFPGRGLAVSWRRLSLGEKVRSTVGTVRRVISRGQLKPLNVEAIPSTEDYLAGKAAVPGGAGGKASA